MLPVNGALMLQQQICEIANNTSSWNSWNPHKAFRMSSVASQTRASLQAHAWRTTALDEHVYIYIYTERFIN